MDTKRKESLEQLRKLAQSVARSIQYLESDLPLFDVTENERVEKCMILDCRWEIRDMLKQRSV
jgi:hypothetical protein